MYRAKPCIPSHNVLPDTNEANYSHRLVCPSVRPHPIQIHASNKKQTVTLIIEERGSAFRGTCERVIAYILLHFLCTRIISWLAVSRYRASTHSQGYDTPSSDSFLMVALEYFVICILFCFFRQIQTSLADPFRASPWFTTVRRRPESHGENKNRYRTRARRPFRRWWRRTDRSGCGGKGRMGERGFRKASWR